MRPCWSRPKAAPTALAAAIEPVALRGVADVGAGRANCVVVTEPGLVGLDELAERIETLALPPPAADAAPTAEIPVIYDGADLAEVARLTGLQPR